MNSDEQEIRLLIERWRTATIAGDVAAIVPLMCDDVVFLTSGRPPFGKKEFMEMSAPREGASRPSIAIAQAILEVSVSSDLAYVVSHIEVAVTRPGAKRAMRRAGHVLSLFRKVEGAWRLARDANFVGPSETKP